MAIKAVKHASCKTHAIGRNKDGVMMSREWKEQLGRNILFFDGAMGTMIQAAGIAVPAIPEELNIDHPKVIQEIHQKFIQAGADFITTNTFGANRLKLENTRYSLPKIIAAAVDNAHVAAEKEGRSVQVVYDIGPIGMMMKPIGSLDFDTAYEIFKEQVLCLDPERVDAVLIETMTDISEMRAAILAVKENSSFPVFATMSFTEDERTLTGTDPETMVRILEGLNVDLLGVNCSLGPVEMAEIVKRILAVSNTPVIVQANAGLPMRIEGETRFSLDEAAYAAAVELFFESGVAVIGGCCGTTPAYIQKLVEKRDCYQPSQKAKGQSGSFVCSSTKSVNLDDGAIVIGERINPSGNKRLKEAFLQGDFQFATKVAFEQIHHGAQVLDINTSLPQIDEEQVMIQLVDTFSGLLDTPLQFDSVKATVLEAALRRYAGIAIVNSISGKQSSMDRLFPLIKKYGAYAVCLCLDEKGIPHTAKERIVIAEKMIANAKKHGIPEERLLIDTLVLTASAQQAEVMETLEAIRTLKAKYRVKTTLGVSNVSYGLPYRPLINRVFFTLALGAGLDTAIINPGAEGIVDIIHAFHVLNNQDPGAVSFIAYNDRKQRPESQADPISSKQDNSLIAKLLEGDERQVEKLILENLKRKAPLAVVDEELIPALDAIGMQYEQQEIFLPQLIRAAETVKGAFELVKSKLAQDHEEFEPKGTIALATVKGDIHDIGKNLVKIMLESYGYRVVDLGKDVDVDVILAAIRKHQIQLVGLSALMTTTVAGMEEIIQSIRLEFDGVKIMVGGAVLTDDYAKQIGADFYCRDARASVFVADQVLK